MSIEGMRRVIEGCGADVLRPELGVFKSIEATQKTRTQLNRMSAPVYLARLKVVRFAKGSFTLKHKTSHTQSVSTELR